MEYCTHIQVLLLVFFTCHTLGEVNKTAEDVPLTVNLSQKLVGRKNESSLFMEGGSLNKSTLAPSAKEPMTNMSSILPPERAMADSWPGHDKNSNIKARKGVSVHMDETSSTTVAPCTCCVNITTQEELKNCSCCPSDFKIPPPVPTTSISITSAITKQMTQTSQLPKVTISTTSTTIVPSTDKPVVIHHQKPNVTADAPDQQVPAQQEDYVIPVVGIIFAIPLIVILGALVYKKGADLWERRHYRRMDFLIDGIYNQ